MTAQPKKTVRDSKPSTALNADVVVVGAGPAGCSAAILFARAGARVVLIERSPQIDAYKKMCTHLIQPSATEAMQQIGLLQKFMNAGARTGSCLTWTPHGSFTSPQPGASFQQAYAYNLRREKLDPLLRRMALATPGIELILGATVTAVEKHNGLITGVTLHNLKGQQRTITTSLTVGADGRNSIVARLAGIPARRRENNRFGYFAYYRNLHLPTGVTRQMWFCDPDMGYMFATDEDLTLAACILTRDKLKYFKQDLEKAFTSFFADLPSRPTLQNAERVSKILGKIDMPLLYRQASKPGLALVGDAALSTDPLCGGWHWMGFSISTVAC